MRENDDGRNAVFPWSVSQRVFGAIDGLPGRVVSVDEQFGTFIVKWDDGDFPVVYPEGTIMIRRAFPWE